MVYQGTKSDWTRHADAFDGYAKPRCPKVIFVLSQSAVFWVINLFFGISILFDSISSLIMVFAFSVTILLYSKFIEEKELEKRFGGEYLAYKRTTPFIIPIPSLLRRTNIGEKQ